MKEIDRILGEFDNERENALECFLYVIKKLNRIKAQGRVINKDDVGEVQQYLRSAEIFVRSLIPHIRLGK